SGARCRAAASAPPRTPDPSLLACSLRPGIPGPRPLARCASASASLRRRVRGGSPHLVCVHDARVRSGTLPSTVPPVRLGYGEAEERFRAELVAWLEEHAPGREILTQPRRSSADLTDWGRAWQRTLFDAGWLVPGWPPELGGRNASASEQMIY